MNKETMQLSIFPTPIASGSLNGVTWRSATTIETLLEIEYKQIIKEIRSKYPSLRNAAISFDDYIKHTYGCTLHEILQKPIDRKRLYLSKSKYRNNKIVRI